MKPGLDKLTVFFLFSLFQEVPQGELVEVEHAFRTAVGQLAKQNFEENMITHETSLNPASSRRTWPPEVFASEHS